MKVRIICLGVVVVTMAGSACASLKPSMAAPLKKGTIELWRDAADKCHTSTTPYLKVKKGEDRKIEWKIVDRVRCTDSLDVEVRFDKGDADPLATCAKKNKNKIECNLDGALTGPRKYSVWIGTEQEDPVLEIEQI